MAYGIGKTVLMAMVIGLSGVKTASAEGAFPNGQESGGSTNTQAFDGTSISLTNSLLGKTVSQSVHSRVWSHVSAVTNKESRTVIFRTNTVNEIAGGLNRVNANNQLISASPEIVVFLDGSGAAATNGTHKCFWPADAGANGDEEYSLKVTPLNGQTLKFKPVGVAFHDFIHDNSVWVSLLKSNCPGSVEGNSVTYADCMDNQSGHRIDIVYSNSLAGIEQNFVFKQKPGQADLPETFGMDPRNVWLECWTEIIGLQQEPQIQQEIRKGWQQSTIDKVIKFGNGEGSMAIGEGTAFGVNGNGTMGQHEGLPVRKHYVTYTQTNMVNEISVVSSRKFLVEEISWRFAATQIAKLAAPQHAAEPLKKKSTSNVAFNQKLSPESHEQAQIKLLAQSKRSPKTKMRSVSATGRKIAAVVNDPSFWIDFDLVNSSGDIVLEGGKTWYVSGTVNADSLIIEPTAVIKMTNGSVINVSGTVTCLTTNYAPAIFTAYNDNTVGEDVSDDAISFTNRSANVVLSLGSGGNLHNLQIRYAKTGIYSSEHAVAMQDMMFSYCTSALDMESTTFTLNNCLAWYVATPFYGSFFHGTVQHLTFDAGNHLTSDWNYHSGIGCDILTPPSSQITLVNSLLTSYGDAGNVSLVYTNDTVWLTDGTGVYTNVGSAGHYLAPDSPYRGAGTGTISSGLASSLARKTTYPPIVYQAVSFTDSPNLSPQAPRETSWPYDVGYAYDPIDFAFGYVDFDNVSLTIAPGTGIATFWAPLGLEEEYGLNMTDSSQISCAGTPNNPVHFCHYNMVQEPASTNWIGNETMLMDDGSSSLLSFRFADWSVFAQDIPYISHDNMSCGRYNFQDCEFQAGQISAWGPTLIFTNCLFERVSSSLWGYIWCELDPVVRNCTFIGGSLSLDNLYSLGSWTVQDNLFDRTILYQVNTFTTVSYNGYVTTNYGRWLPTNSNDVILTNSPAYQKGTLGRFYYPTNLPLINAGSQTADAAGLFHYTTTTNQVKETNSIVDIGYHYVATGTNGNPLDYDNDLWPDYLEDANGNGVADGGETDWQVSNRNNAPVVTVPGAQAAFENESIVFSGISVSDSDAGANSILVSLSAWEGSLTLTTTNGLTFMEGTNGVTANLSMEGNLTDLNAALATLSFFGGTNYSGSNVLTITANDLGNTGSDGPKSDVKTIPMLVVVSPSGLTNVLLWLRADRDVLTNGSGYVSQWTDQSASHNDFTQGTSAYQPTLITNGVNGWPMIHFTPSAQTRLTGSGFTGVTNAEAFVVLRVATNYPASDRALWSAGGYARYPDTSGEIVDNLFSDAPLHEFGVVSQPLDQFHIFNVSARVNDRWIGRINGIMQFNQPITYLTLPASFSLGFNGGSVFFDGDVAEVVVFSRVLSDDERNTMGAYLNYKYALTASPAAPTNLTVGAISTSQISVSWSSLLTNSATRFRIERGVSDVSFTQIAEQENNASYIDTGLTEGTSYYYRVKAVNYAGESAYSLTNSATTFFRGTNLPLSELALWLKADAGRGPGAIDYWQDQSGNHSDATQFGSMSLTKKPVAMENLVNGRPAIRFASASNQFLYLPVNLMGGTTAAEAYVLVRAASTNPASAKSLWSFDTTATSYPNTSGQIDAHCASGASHLMAPSAPLDQFQVYSFCSQNNLWEGWINGFLQARATGNGYEFFSNPTLGSSSGTSFDGDIAEVMLFVRALTTDERYAVGAYFNQKYGSVTTPLAPTNLTVTAISPGQISLNWKSVLTNSPTRFDIQRRTGTTFFSTIAVIENSCSYVDSGVTVGTGYEYRIKAVNYAGESTYSSTGSATTTSAGTDLPLSDLRFWLKADAVHGAGTVNYVVDQSGNHNDLSQTVGTQLPSVVENVLNGKPVLHFTAANNDYLTGPGPIPTNPPAQGEAFVVLRVVTNHPSVDRGLWVLGGGGSLYPDMSGNLSDAFMNSPQTITSVSQALDQFHIFNVSAHYYGPWLARINGTFVKQTTINDPTTPTSFLLGSSGGSPKFFDGDVAEILIFDRVLTVGERGTVGSYLDQKYNFLTNTLTAPTNFLATGISSSQINLTWTPTSTNVLSHLVERKIGISGDYSLVGTVSSDISNLLDSAVMPGTNYYYRIRANNYFTQAINSNLIAPPITSVTNLPPALLATNFSVGAVASDNDGTVAKVEFMTNGVIIGTLTNAPYNLSVTGMNLASAPLTTRATDNQGNSQISVAVPIIISGDRDGDGVNDLLEISLGTDPTVSDAWVPPGPTLGDTNGPTIYLDEPTQAVLQ